jgi:DNA-binding FrmR family transcriptional regulator
VSIIMARGLSTHHHVHDEDSLRRIVNRLSRIEGHIRGIKTMVQESRPCPDVLVQVAAVRGALDRVARIILDEHLTQCIARAAEEGNIEVEIEELRLLWIDFCLSSTGSDRILSLY